MGTAPAKSAKPKKTARPEKQVHVKSQRSKSAAPLPPPPSLPYEASSPPQRTTTKTLSKDVFESLRGQRHPLGAKQQQQQQQQLPQRARRPNNKLPLYLDDANEDNDEDADVDHQDDDDGDDDENDDDDEDEYGDGGGQFDDDEGTIHPFGPHVDPKLLLSTLTQTSDIGISDADVQLLPDDDGADFNPAFKRKLFSNFARTHANIGKPVFGAAAAHGEAALRPGAPRDVVAQIVNPRFVALNWLEPATHPDEVTSYTVYYKMTTSER